MKPGLFVRIWRYLFGGPQALPAGAAPPAPSDETRRAKCPAWHCRSLADPRCEAGNCTSCCHTWCPEHRCGKQAPTRVVRFVTEQTATMRDVADLFRAAPAVDVASIITCPCGQKNRVRHGDYGKGPVCGRCKRTLGLPS